MQTPTLPQEIPRSWARIGSRFLPFADAATPDLPLSRLLRLSLFQVSVGMALVLMIGTLTRVMIVELKVPAALVGIMISLPLIFVPFRALIGFRSDHHRSALGWRRVPYLWMGTMVQFGGWPSCRLRCWFCPVWVMHRMRPLGSGIWPQVSPFCW